MLKVDKSKIRFKDIQVFLNNPDLFSKYFETLTAEEIKEIKWKSYHISTIIEQYNYDVYNKLKKDPDLKAENLVKVYLFELLTKKWLKDSLSEEEYNKMIAKTSSDNDSIGRVEERLEFFYQKDEDAMYAEYSQYDAEIIDKPYSGKSLETIGEELGHTSSYFYDPIIEEGITDYKEIIERINNHLSTMGINIEEMIEEKEKNNNQGTQLQ